MTQQAKFSYSPLGKAFEQPTKIIEEQVKSKLTSFRSFKATGK